MARPRSRDRCPRYALRHGREDDAQCDSAYRLPRKDHHFCATRAPESAKELEYALSCAFTARIQDRSDHEREQKLKGYHAEAAHLPDKPLRNVACVRLKPRRELFRSCRSQLLPHGGRLRSYERKRLHPIGQGRKPRLAQRAHPARDILGIVDDRCDR